MNEEVRERLLRLIRQDEIVRAELAAEGSLFGGYHARMEAVHRENAAQLREMIAEYGWPTFALAGDDGAEAAWRIAQHSIGEPAFMRTCRALVDAASERGEVPRWQFEYLDDRIRVFEGRAQLFGTQVPRPADQPGDDASELAWRRSVGWIS